MSAGQIGGISSNTTQPTSVPTARASSAAAALNPGTADQKAAAAGKQPGTPELRDALKKIETVLSPNSSDLRFSIDEDTGITVIKLIDTQTDTVLRQIPTVEVLEISKALDKLQGLLVKEKA